MPTPVPSTTPSQHYNTSYENSVWIPEIIANETLGPLNAYLNLGKTVAADSDITSQSVGDTINVTKRGTLTSYEKEEDEPVHLQQPKGSKVPVVLNHHREVSFGEEDFIASIQAGSPVPGYINDAVAVLAQDIEEDIMSHFDEFESFSTSGTSMIDQVGQVRQKLVEKKVPKLLQKFAYVHPSVVTALLKENAFKDPKVGQFASALTDGTVGRVHDLDFFEASLIEAAGSPAAYSNLVYVRNALVLASRPLRQPDSSLGVQSAVVQSDAGIAVRVLRSYNASLLAVQITVDVLFGSAVMDDRLGLNWITH